jgi:hypothetical protein
MAELAILVFVTLLLARVTRSKHLDKGSNSLISLYEFL